MKVSSEEEVQGLYEESANAYSEMMDREIDLPVYADVLGRLARGISELQGPLVDTSCGSGHMLSRYRERYDSERPLVGIDLSPRMVAIARARLSSRTEVLLGDMRNLEDIKASSAAAVLSYFALHHVTPEDALEAFREWRRVLRPGGQLVLATWEGEGTIDYGAESDVVAQRYTKDEVVRWVHDAGFSVSRCVIEPVEGLPMDAIYLEGRKRVQ